jgi:hypothetical protein
MAGYIWVAVCHDPITNVQFWPVVPVGEDATERPLASSEPANGCSPCRLLNEYSQPRTAVRSGVRPVIQMAALRQSAAVALVRAPHRNDHSGAADVRTRCFETRQAWELA